MQTSTRREFAGGGEQHSSGLVVAVLGDVNPTDIAALSRLRAGSTRSLCILLDVASWARADNVGAGDLASVQSRAHTLQRQGWTVRIANPSDRLPSLWGDFGNPATAALSYVPDAGVTEGSPAA
jgi:hypothetical protein